MKASFESFSAIEGQPDAFQCAPSSNAFLRGPQQTRYGSQVVTTEIVLVIDDLGDHLANDTLVRVSKIEINQLERTPPLRPNAIEPFSADPYPDRWIWIHQEAFD